MREELAAALGAGRQYRTDVRFHFGTCLWREGRRHGSTGRTHAPPRPAPTIFATVNPRGADAHLPVKRPTSRPSRRHLRERRREQKEKSAKGERNGHFRFGIDTGVFPIMIFMGVGAMTDFGPLIANPKSALLGGRLGRHRLRRRRGRPLHALPLTAAQPPVGGHHARGKVVADHEHRNKKGTE